MTGDRHQPLLSDILTARLRSDKVLRDIADDSDRRKPPFDRAVADAQAAAVLGLALADLGEENQMPIEALAHCLAAVLATTRQSFFQVNDMSDRRLQEVMPMITHLSGLAESMVHIADRAEAQADEDSHSQSGSAGAVPRNPRGRLHGV